MSRACSPGGRFSSDYERCSISSGINADLTNAVGTSVDWWIFNLDTTAVDPIYDTGDNYPLYTDGKQYIGPFTVPVIKAVITQGQTKTSQQGFYNADILHLTLNYKDAEALIPGIMQNPDDLGRDRVVWKGEVWRPYQAQQKGIIEDTWSLLTIELTQVMPEELVNDPQFLNYAPAGGPGDGNDTYGTGGYGNGPYGD